MSSESLPASASIASDITFAARKVRMAREYYVEAKAPGRMKYRIGSFKLRARAKEWIKVHSAAWREGSGSLWSSELQNVPDRSNTATATDIRP